MVNCLRENFIYSEKRARDFIFSSMDAILADTCSCTSPPKLARLTRETALRSREAADRAGFAFATWETTTRAVVNSMLGAGVLLTEDGLAVPMDIRAQATAIVALKPDYRDTVEAYLLECLPIRNLGDVSTSRS